ncbi:MAG: HAMP domain-containing histidine kinase [Gammaproteobacteria bacterium]|nr:HAMP domain-containing histidine kinase [Gammaproteobacteria bacterium]
MSNIESEFEKQLPIEQLALLHKQSFVAFAATIAVLLYILFWIHDSVDSYFLSLWVGAVIVLNVYLIIWIYFVHQASLNSRIDTKKAKRFIFIYQIQSVLHGSSWGLLPFLLIDLSTPEMKFFAYIILCGMAAGAIGTTAMIFRIYLSFMLPMMLPVILTQLVFADAFPLFSQNTLGVLIIFVISVIVLAHSHYESIKRSIVLMVENKQLLNDVTQAFSKSATASKAKSNFLTNMSHELRTPLNAVIGYSEIIYDCAQDNDFKTIPGDAKKITKAGQHLLSLINNVLDLSKIESGKMQVFVEDINVYNLLNEIKETTEALTSKNKNTLNFEVPENLCIVKTDSTKLRQILFNIIGNAAKFTKDGEITISAVPDPEKLKISIVDTGIGMTAEQLDDLTTPFMQADISTTRKYGGTGLGMNLTKLLADLLGIEIEIQSQPNKGTRFDLTVPLVYKRCEDT